MLIISAFIVLIIGIILLYINSRRKKDLEDNYTTLGTIIKYKRIGKYLYPVIEFKENNELKNITYKGGLVNYKPIKTGTEIKMITNTCYHFILY